MMHPPPLAESLRPTLSLLEHLTGHARKLWDRELKRWREVQKAHLIFWGPPGCGKTTLALLLCESQREYSSRQLSAVRDGIGEIKKAIDALPEGGILFIDEIHRLTRPQQDLLLPTLESGRCWLLAATTENPAAVMSPALLSRVRTQRVHPPSNEEIVTLLNHALDLRTGAHHLQLQTDQNCRSLSEIVPTLAERTNGDVRLALNILEGLIHCEDTQSQDDLLSGQLSAWTGKSHYDYASAMIKSMRGSDPDAALFYAYAALESGEDANFLLRRCIIFASEDVGNADPAALRIALDCADAFERVGMPEGRYAIAQAVCYLSSTVKSNRLLRALQNVGQWWSQSSADQTLPAPPAHLIMRGHEKYRYPHDFPRSFVREQYLPDSIEKMRRTSGPAYLPSEEGAESRLRDRLASLWNK
ncbi:MAG: hypothetical protein RL189_290 [Pseudomonadota bacterium]|jgi:putative ATPase